MHASGSHNRLSLLGQPARFAGGLRDLGGNLYAWMQPNGGLGESNAGLIAGAEESLLVDTLWDTHLTRAMLTAMEPITRGAPIRRLVNTHGDGDHCWGNQLLEGAEILATAASAQDMLHEDPGRLRALSRGGAALARLGRGAPPAAVRQRLQALPAARKLAGLGAFARMLAAYNFDEVELTPPTVTFQGRLELELGGRRVELVEAGPAHTPGDAFVHVPEEEVLFAGDLVFAGVTPIMWVGPVENWLRALDQVIERGPRLVVPGHGPLSDLDGVRAVRAYWMFVADAVRARIGTGLDPFAAARDIIHSREFGEQVFASWEAPERLAINAAIIARNDRGQRGRVPPGIRLRLIAQMGELAGVLAR